MKNRWFKILVKLFIEITVVLLIGTLILYLFSADFNVFKERWLSNLAYSGILGYTLWKGNEYGFLNIHKYKKWEKKIRLKFISGVLYVLIYSTLALILVELFLNVVWLGRSISVYEFPSLRYLLIIIGVCFTISFIISIIHFIGDKKQNLINEEQLKAKILKLEYEALRNQLSPHFLFNSLNALTSLVGDNEDAVKFIKNLSDFYRYVLEQKDKEVVALETELSFLKIFYSIQKIKFGKKINLKININKLEKNVVPLSLQILIENIIKNGRLDLCDPLNISVIESGDFLIIETEQNSLNIDSMENDNSLQRINKRYKHLTNESFELIKESDKLIMKLPLLEVEK